LALTVKVILAAASQGYHRDVGEPVSTEGAGVAWLTDEELHTWLSVVRLMAWLPWSIDQQLRRDADLAMVEYQVLAMLSSGPGRSRRMSMVAEAANVSLSHLSRIVSRLEHRRLVRRQADPTDGRFTVATLTDEGLRTLEAAAPAHVAHVRTVLIDALSPEQLRRLGRDADRILARIDRSAINPC
jgi:DNA-binding MarR family transcriptional regulator